MIILSIGRVIQVFISLASIKILTTMLNEQEVGNYYLLLTILTLLNFAFFNPIGQFYGRYIIKWNESNDLLNATNVLLILRINAILISLIVSFIIYNIFEYNIYYELSDFLLFIFVSLLASGCGVLLNTVNILGNRIKFTLYVLFTSTLGLFLSICIVLFLEKSSMGWLYGLMIAQMISFCLLYNSIRANNVLDFQRMKLAFNKDYIIKTALFIMPVTITLFLQWGQNQSYRFIIESKYSLEVLAFIGVGFGVSSAIFSAVESLAAQIYNPVYLKKITNASKNDRTCAWNNLASYILPIYLILTLYVIVCSPYLIRVLTAEKFYDASIYVVFGAVIEFLRVTTNLIYKVSTSEVKSTSSVLPYATGFVVTMVSLYFFDLSENLWLIPTFLIMSNLIVLLLLFKNMRKLLDIRFDVNKLVSSFVLASPLFLFLFVDDNNTLLQALLMLGIGGVFFLFLSVLIIRGSKEEI